MVARPHAEYQSAKCRESIGGGNAIEPAGGGDRALSQPAAVRSRLYVLVCVKNRHRGSGHPLAPATPPYMRVRIRRFGRVELPRQARKTDRVEVSVGKREAESRAIRQVPRASALPLLPDHGAQSASRPLIQSVQHRGSLAVAEVPFPAA